MSTETDIRVGDVVSHDKYADEDRFLVVEVDGGVVSAEAISPDTGDTVGHAILLATCRLTRHASDETAQSGR